MTSDYIIKSRVTPAPMRHSLLSPRSEREQGKNPHPLTMLEHVLIANAYPFLPRML
jgi:hypothetical protein